MAQFMKTIQSNLDSMGKHHETISKNYEASIKNMEIKIGQLSRQLGSQISGGSTKVLWIILRLRVVMSLS